MRPRGSRATFSGHPFVSISALVHPQLQGLCDLGQVAFLRSSVGSGDIRIGNPPPLKRSCAEEQEGGFASSWLSKFRRRGNPVAAPLKERIRIRLASEPAGFCPEALQLLLLFLG